MESVEFPGCAGQLEGRLELRGEPAVVLCHPHPMMGGSMDDLVLAAMDSGLASANVSSLRFNFRGVGGSEGTYDEGHGEVDDVLCAISFLRETRQVKRLFIGGYSFGAVMALRAAGRSSSDGLLLVAPPVGRLAAEKPGLPTLVILGDRDQFVEVGETRKYFASHARVEVLEGSDHFFMGESESIRQIVSDFLFSLAN